MAQKKNSVVLSSTALSKLQMLVDSGEYCSIDDAASHIITSVLGSTGKYSPKPIDISPKTDLNNGSTQGYKSDSVQEAEKPIETTVVSESKPNLAKSLLSI